MGRITQFEQNTALFAKLIQLLLRRRMAWQGREFEIDHMGKWDEVQLQQMLAQHTTERHHEEWGRVKVRFAVQEVQRGKSVQCLLRVTAVIGLVELNAGSQPKAASKGSQQMSWNKKKVGKRCTKSTRLCLKVSV